MDTTAPLAGLPPIVTTPLIIPAPLESAAILARPVVTSAMTEIHRMKLFIFLLPATA